MIKGGAPGRYRITAQAYDQGHPGGPRPTRTLGWLEVDGPPASGRLPTRLVEPPRVTEWRRRRPAERSLEASGAPTYQFAQQHRDALPWWEGRWRPQRVVSGARLRVQLPGDPIRWVPRTGAGCQPTPWPGGRQLPAAEIQLEAQAIIPNPGRIEGAEVLYQFDYRVTGRGVAVVCLDPDPVPDDPEALSFPPDSPLDYSLTVLVR